MLHGTQGLPILLFSREEHSESERNRYDHVLGGSGVGASGALVVGIERDVIERKIRVMGVIRNSFICINGMGYIMIETDRLKLQLMKQNDIDDIFKIFSDKKVQKAFGIDSFTFENMQNWVNRNLTHQDKYGYGLFSVILKAENKLIGDCGLEHSDFSDKTCVEIGYDFLSEFWNYGYATEAATAVKEFAINNQNIQTESICSFIRKSNIPSKRVSEKIGMSKILEYSKNDIEYFLYGFPSEYFE